MTNCFFTDLLMTETDMVLGFMKRCSDKFPDDKEVRTNCTALSGILFSV